MWVQLFSVVFAVAIGFAVAALVLEANPEKKARRARVSVFR